MNQEQKNLKEHRPDTRPPSGKTIIVRAKNEASHELLERLTATWYVLASCGRYNSEDEPLPLTEEEKRQQLIHLFDEETILDLPADFELWDREFMWWSSAVFGDYIKIDLDTFAMPTSFTTIKDTIRLCRGELIAVADWVNSTQLQEML